MHLGHTFEVIQIIFQFIGNFLRVIFANRKSHINGDNRHEVTAAKIIDQRFLCFIRQFNLINFGFEIGETFPELTVGHIVKFDQQESESLPARSL